MAPEICGVTIPKSRLRVLRTFLYQWHLKDKIIEKESESSI